MSQRLLVQVETRGYDVNHRDPENVTLLHWASINNRVDIVKYLLVKGPGLAFLSFLGRCDVAATCSWL